MFLNGFSRLAKFGLSFSEMVQYVLENMCAHGSAGLEMQSFRPPAVIAIPIKRRWENIETILSVMDVGLDTGHEG